jgi:hypothetical protein
MTDIAGLIRKHASTGVVVDSNLLVLYLVGRVNRRRITRFKRTRAYSEEDFEVLAGFLRSFRKRFATPTVWAEVSNLTDLDWPELAKMRRIMREEMELTIEEYRPSRDLAGYPVFATLGVTDASISDLSERGLLVLTDDLDLHVWLLDHGADSCNFNQIRPV